MSGAREAVHVVVARYHEDIGWLHALAHAACLQSFDLHVFVYDKGPVPWSPDEVKGFRRDFAGETLQESAAQLTYTHLPNLGMEADTYVRHIMRGPGSGESPTCASGASGASSPSMHPDKNTRTSAIDATFTL